MRSAASCTTSRSWAKHSARIQQVIDTRKQQKRDNPDPTPAQINLLRHLHATHAEIAACTTIWCMHAGGICPHRPLVDKRQLEGPKPASQAQLAFLQRLEYKGTPHANVSQASKLIDIMKHRRTVNNSMAKALGRGVSQDKVARMPALLQSFMRTQKDAYMRRCVDTAW